MGPYYPKAEYTTKELFERNWSGRNRGRIDGVEGSGE